MKKKRIKKRPDKQSILNKHITIIPYSVLICVKLLVFSQVFTFKFISWDDGLHIYSNPYLSSITIKNIAHFWSNSHQGLYIPLTYTMWAILIKISLFTLI